MFYTAEQLLIQESCMFLNENSFLDTLKTQIQEKLERMNDKKMNVKDLEQMKSDIEKFYPAAKNMTDDEVKKSIYEIAKKNGITVAQLDSAAMKFFKTLHIAAMVMGPFFWIIALLSFLSNDKSSFEGMIENLTYEIESDENTALRKSVIWCLLSLIPIVNFVTIFPAAYYSIVALIEISSGTAEKKRFVLVK